VRIQVGVVLIRTCVPVSTSVITVDLTISHLRLCIWNGGDPPKTYELRVPTFLTGIASFQDGYLISGG
jgi:hypothetical protein